MAAKRTNKANPIVHTSSSSRKYFLLDASAYLRLLEGASNPAATEKMKLLLAKRGSDSAYLYMPNCCVAEVFNGFAKKHFREGEINKTEYTKFHEGFGKQIRYANVIKSYDLNYYHVIGVDWITEEEHTFETKRKNRQGEEREWCLSAFDILIISMGIELAGIHGLENFAIVTADRRIAKICKRLRALQTAQREQRGIPSAIIFPRCFCIQDTDINEIRRFCG